MATTDAVIEGTGNCSSTATCSDEDVLMNPHVEIPFLIIVILIGIVGNVFVIGATLVERQLRNMGVTFIINLAVADLIITAWYLPVVLANVIAGYRNVFAHAQWLCHATGFLSAWCCQVSMLTLMFIGFNRYFKATRGELHSKWFRRRLITFFVIFIWVECFLVALPLIIGWFGMGESTTPAMIRFDPQMVACMWNDHVAPGYNIFLVVIAIFIPILATVFFYISILLHIRRSRATPRDIASPSGKEIRFHPNNVRPATDMSSFSEEQGASSNIRTHHARHNSINSHKTARSRRAEERERHLVLTLAVVVIFFVLFWMPYALMTLFTTHASTLAKRACGWLALSNSAINSIIYGVFNRNFRRGYVKLFRKMCSLICCCCSETVKDLLEKGLSNNIKMTTSANDEYKQYNVKFGKS
ncbi:melatonin receptor type 1A-like [Clavelina lepadiformis]|uniref:G-protein coupled receptors family 1 profile domain-containing protein n=1 Tax=Clavelina lepadiformis TaxID=159417 RepID=A0ABP0GLJ8_CLALP